MDKKINVAVQILPFGQSIDKYAIIDKAIEVVQQSGLKHKVCPFETVIEGYYDEIFEIIKKMQQEAYKHGAEALLVNIRIQSMKGKDVFIRDKLKNYEL